MGYGAAEAVERDIAISKFRFLRSPSVGRANQSLPTSPSKVFPKVPRAPKSSKSLPKSPQSLPEATVVFKCILHAILLRPQTEFLQRTNESDIQLDQSSPGHPGHSSTPGQPTPTQAIPPHPRPDIQLHQPPQAIPPKTNKPMRRISILGDPAAHLARPALNTLTSPRPAPQFNHRLTASQHSPAAPATEAAATTTTVPAFISKVFVRVPC